MESVLDEFPDLSQLKESVSNYNSGTELKYASEGMGPLSDSAFTLTSYINSGVMMDWLSDVTGINDSLISDPYLRGGGYHEIKRGGFLKVHADFNKHERYFIDRRLNLLIYLNKSWDRSWGGGLQFFDRSMRRSLKTIYPDFNTAVLFTTTSETLHGHPDPLTCPVDRSGKSLAYYFYSAGEGLLGTESKRHTTLFYPRQGESLQAGTRNVRAKINDFIPPILSRAIRRLF